VKNELLDIIVTLIKIGYNEILDTVIFIVSRINASGYAAILAVTVGGLQLQKIHEQLKIASDDNKINKFAILLENERNIGEAKKNYQNAIIDKNNALEQDNSIDTKDYDERIEIENENYLNQLERLASLILKLSSFEKDTGMQNDYSKIIKDAVDMYIKENETGIYNNIEELNKKWQN
jgi:hypothetical protein